MSSELASNILNVVALLSIWRFVVMYGIRTPWRATLPGRSFMYMAGSLALILTYAFASRWLGMPDDLRQDIGVWVYSLLVWSLIWLNFALEYTQKGRVTVEKPNYTPVRDWLRKLRARRAKRRAKRTEK